MSRAEKSAAISDPWVQFLIVVCTLMLVSAIARIAEYL